jgi:hypothetical protein
LTFYRISDRILIEENTKGGFPMDYDKIILELMSRIQILEEKVNALTESNSNAEKAPITTKDIFDHINEVKAIAKAEGKSKLTLLSRDIHKDLNLTSRYPMVCNAMRQCMKDGDRILFQPPKGNSSTLEIEYTL